MVMLYTVPGFSASIQRKPEKWYVKEKWKKSKLSDSTLWFKLLECFSETRSDANVYWHPLRFRACRVLEHWKQPVYVQLFKYIDFSSRIYRTIRSSRSLLFYCSQQWCSDLYDGAWSFHLEEKSRYKHWDTRTTLFKMLSQTIQQITVERFNPKLV